MKRRRYLTLLGMSALVGCTGSTPDESGSDSTPTATTTPTDAPDTATPEPTSASTAEPTTTPTATATEPPTAPPTDSPTATASPTPTATRTPSPTPTPAPSSQPVVGVIEYDGEWQGSLSITEDGGSQSRSVSGSGDWQEQLGTPQILALNAQKQDDSSATLRVALRQGGTVLTESETSAAYGMAQVSQSFF